MGDQGMVVKGNDSEKKSEMYRGMVLKGNDSGKKWS